MKKKMHFEVSLDDPSVAYLYLPGHLGKDAPAVVKQICLADIITNYRGPDIYLDIDKTGHVIGIEILT